MFVLARIQIFREIPQGKDFMTISTLEIFHTFVYERKAFATQCNFSYFSATNRAGIPIFNMGQIREIKCARVEIFRLSYFGVRIL